MTSSKRNLLKVILVLILCAFIPMIFTGCSLYKKYEITYMLAGGENNIDNPHSFTKKDEFVLLSPNKEGYVFDGWYTNSDYTNRIEKVSKKTKTNLTVYAKWTPITYTVAYGGNGATGGETASSTHTYDKASALTKNGFEKTGYIFAGWNTKVDGTGTAYVDEASIKNLTSTKDSTVTLYAQWTFAYTVAYDGNGATGGSIESSTHIYGVSKNLTPNGFTRYGYTFTGWNTEADGTGTTYGDEASVTDLTSTQGVTVTLYAQWTVNIHKITFNKNGGTSGTGELWFRYGTDDTFYTDAECQNVYSGGTTIEVPTRTGYIFKDYYCVTTGVDSWFNSEGCYNKEYSRNNIFALDRDLDFDSRWTAITYTVEYDGNGATGGETATSTHTYDNASALTKNGFAKTGYIFAGWNTMADGTGTAYGDEASVTDLASTQDAIVTLYAQWTFTYTVEYNGNEATSGTTASSTHIYGVSNNLTANGFAKIGYTFTGWNTKADGTGTTYGDEASIKNLASTKDDTVILYAQWSANTYTVKYDGNEATSGETESSTHIYDKASALAVNRFEKTGYIFAGWNTKADGTGTAYEELASIKNLTPTKDAIVTLYAQWIAITYTVAYDGNGATGGETATSTHTYDKASALAVNRFEKTGYIFAGWNTKADGTGTAYEELASIKNLTPTKDAIVTLYAQWTFVVKYNGNGATDGSTESSTHFYGVEKNLTANGFARYGYTFTGWNTKADGTGTAYGDEASIINLSSMPDGVVTLYAQWSANIHKITFNKNGGTGGTSELWFRYGTDDTFYTDAECQNVYSGGTMIEIPERTGYKFKYYYCVTSNIDSWFDSTGCYDDGYSREYIFELDSDLDFEAGWEAITYTIAYDGNGATSGLTESSTHTYDIWKALTANGFTRTGYTFVNWNTKADGTGTAYEEQDRDIMNLASTQGAVITLYAQWTVSIHKITFNKNGGAGGTSELWFRYGDDDIFYTDAECKNVYSGGTTIEIPEKVDCKFRWYYCVTTDIDLWFDGEGHYDKRYSRDNIFELDSDLTFEAEWITLTTITSEVDCTYVTSGGQSGSIAKGEKRVLELEIGETITFSAKIAGSVKKGKTIVDTYFIVNDVRKSNETKTEKTLSISLKKTETDDLKTINISTKKVESQALVII